LFTNSIVYNSTNSKEFALGVLSGISFYAFFKYMTPAPSVKLIEIHTLARHEDSILQRLKEILKPLQETQQNLMFVIPQKPHVEKLVFFQLLDWQLAEINLELKSLNVHLQTLQQLFQSERASLLVYLPNPSTFSIGYFIRACVRLIHFFIF
jgi:hypothetical protein